MRRAQRKPTKPTRGRIDAIPGPISNSSRRKRRDGWTAWGNELDGYDRNADVEGSFNEAYRAIRERVAAGGPKWVPK